MRSNLSQGLLVLCVLILPCSGLHAAEWTPDPSLENPQLHQRLYDIGRHYAELNFDPAANLVGSQSKHPPNKKQHSTRESTYYALGLLMTGDPADRERAQKILAHVVHLQDDNTISPTYGAFNWNAEDPPSDVNSAAFVGLTLADIMDLDRQHPCLDVALRSEVEKATRTAIAGVMRRNVDAGYTNIAFLSTALVAAGQKLWAIPGTAEWAQSKLDGIMKLAGTGDGEFAEYLSPTYNGVALDGAYSARKFAFSDAFAAEADAAINHLWKQIAAAYHAPTYQLGGPYLRAYGDNMLTYAAGLKYFLYLGLGGNYPLPDDEKDHDWDKAGQMAVAALPVTIRPELKSAPPALRQWDAVGTPPTPLRHLTQYREGNFILGTVAFQDEWKQKRNLVADWRNDGPPPLGFRLGYCIDESCESIPGFEGAKLHFYCQQEKSAALVAMVASTDVPGQGVSSLVFDDGAVAQASEGGPPLRIVDGTITTYLYPISGASVTYDKETDPAHHVMRITRSWNSADLVDSLHVLSYLIVFRPSQQPAPTVSDVLLKPDKGGVTASANLDGESLSVSFKN